MSETCGFFEAEWDDTLTNPETGELGDWDKRYLAEQYARYFALFIGNGVFGSPTDQLKVSAGTGMSVIVSSGNAFVNGYWYNNDEPKVISVPANNTSSSRVDSVRVRFDLTNRQITIEYFAGDIDIVRGDNVYDLKLAEIVVPALSTEVLQSNISDMRTNEDVCGFVTELLKVQTTKDLFDQYQALFEEWFNGVKDQVTGDLAIRLQQEFTELNQKVEDYQSDVTDVANGAKNTIDEFVAKYFVIDVQSLIFVDKVCKVTDSRITSKSLIDVYFTADTMKEAESCQMYVDSFDGYATITAEKQPESLIKAAISVKVV